ncbi:TetR family transcriptional regulator [Cellulomonas sp. WB94]|uniref:TetR/AcrR family transcriptional regulator n=1 Tax=Cellulomonas sp. WB94 TaxID=2173174 RepID=UPI001F5BB79B|nr:TetR family transcriptional regulator [Cellulomonas sp. WB94]
MGTAAVPDERSASDLTARARIRDVAIEAFALEGFGASFRTIAARADVSPGLITHHFGSKAALRAECDAEVLRHYRALKTEAIADPSASLFAQLTVPGVASTITVYMLRAVNAGGEPARRFLDSLVDQARVVMAQSVASGLARPSRDEEARLRYLTHQAMGAMLVRFLTSPGLTPDEFIASLHDAQKEAVLPILELYTEGLLASRQMLDDYLEYLWEPPGGRTEGPASPQTA